MKSRTTTKKPQSPTSTFQLAQHLGLSEWTVSRAINGHPEVKASTRERIMQAMDELGFRPNPVARGLSGKAMGIVGICFGNPHNAVMIDKITLLDAFLREHQIRGILAISPKDVESELRILSDFRHLRVDGIVMIQSFLGVDKLGQALEGMKSVHVDASDSKLTPNVSLDRARAMRMEVDHLVDLGHRSFVVLGFSPLNGWRWDGMAQAMRDRGIDTEKNLHFHEFATPGAESFPEGIKLAQMVLAEKKPPTAWICVNDRVAAGAIQQIENQGLRVPHDFSVVGFDNLELGRYLRPTITTIDQQTHLQIEHTGRLLLRELGKLNDDRLKDRMVVEPVLVLGESTGPVPKRTKR